MKEVEKSLLAMEKCQNFSLLVLEIIADESIAEPTRFSAAIYFKNFMKKRWPQVIYKYIKFIIYILFLKNMIYLYSFHIVIKYFN